MRILDKYVLKEMLGPFLFGVCTFTSLFIASSVLFRVAQYISQYGATTTHVIKMLLFSLPEVVNYTFPMSVLLACLTGFGKLSSNSEITAMKSGGISFMRIATPVFVAAFCLSVFSVVFAEKIVPDARTAYRNLVYYEIQGNTKPPSQNHIVVKGIKKGEIERLIYARNFDEVTERMNNLTIEEFDEQGRLKGIQNAEYAIWGDGKWTLVNGTSHEVSENEGIKRSMSFDEQILPLDVQPRDVGLAQKKPDQMTIKEIKMQIDILKRQYLPVAVYETEMYQRFTIPMASVLFAMIGAPLGIQPQRTSSSLGLGLSVVIIFLYYTIMTLATALGQGGTIHPMLAAWIPNLICLGMGLYLMKLRSR